jgi:putative addiction module CopG family antidote
MDVSLTRGLEKFIAAKVKTGAYSSPSAVVRAALHLLQEMSRIRPLDPEQRSRHPVLCPRKNSGNRGSRLSSATTKRCATCCRTTTSLPTAIPPNRAPASENPIAAQQRL